MPTIETEKPFTVPRELAPVVKELVQVLELALEKVALHAHAPAEFPMRAGGLELESILLRQFKLLPKAQQDKAIARAKALSKETTDQRKARLGVMASVNLRLATPVAEQVKPLSPRSTITPERLREIVHNGKTAQPVVADAIAMDE